MCNKTNKELLNGQSRYTKREYLRTMMSVFNPLGLLFEKLKAEDPQICSIKI